MLHSTHNKQDKIQYKGLRLVQCRHQLGDPAKGSGDDNHGHVSLTDLETPAQVTNQALQSPSETAGGHSFVPFNPVAFATHHLIQGMALIFHNHRFCFGNFAHLMALRLEIFFHQQAFYNLADFFRCFQLPPMPMMSFSSPFFLPTQPRLGIASLLRRVARRRFGRVLRVLVQPLLQFFYLLFPR